MATEEESLTGLVPGSSRTEGDHRNGWEAADAAERLFAERRARTGETWMPSFLRERADLAPSPRDRGTRRLLAAADVLAFALATIISSSVFALPHTWYLLALTVGGWMILNGAIGLYGWDTVAIDNSTIHELPRLLQSVLLALGGILLFEPAGSLGTHRHAGVLFGAVLLVSMTCGRAFVRFLVLARFGPERALIIGQGKVADLVTRKLRTHPSYGIEVAGYLGDVAPEGGEELRTPCLGAVSELVEISRAMRIERVLVAYSLLALDEMMEALRTARMLGIKVTVVPRFFELMGDAAILDQLEGISLLSLGTRSGTALTLAAKRALDIVGSGIGLILLSPVLAMISVLIKLDSPGPIVFSQTRIGRGNRPFKIRKFRTMVQNAHELTAVVAHLSEAEWPLLKIPEDRDPRLTRIGRILRRTMLDEAPQLWNVLCGQMSLVGPRPLEPQDDAQVHGWQRTRLKMAPGITGPWQALGRHAIPFPEMLTLDCLYVSDWSLWQDMKLLMRTIQVVLLRSRPI